VNPGVHEYWYTLYGRTGWEMPRPPLAEAEAKFVGDPVAMLLAHDRYVAEDAADLVDVEFEPLNPLVDYIAAQGAETLVHADYPGNVAVVLGAAMSDVVAEAFNRAAHVVCRSIYQQAYAPVPLETRGIIVEWSGEELTVWTGTQAPHEVRLFMARLLGLGEHQVRVIMRDTGGGFGEKVAPLREDACLALAGMQVRVPLKWIEDRRENLVAAGMSRHEHGEGRLAFDGDGRIMGAYLEHVQDVGAYPKPSPVGASAAVGALFPGAYRVPAAGFRTTSVFSNTSGRIAYRGPWQFESVAREVLLDIAARSMGMDPIELRRRNLLREDEMPFRNPNGMTYAHVTPLETFEHAMAILDIDRFRKEQAEGRARGRYLGVGTCSYVEPTTSALGYYATEGATIRIEPTGKVNVYVSGGSAGNSLETAVVQLAADALGVALRDVRTVQGDTAVTPFGGGTGGSRSGSMLAGAITATAAVLRQRIVAIAAHLLEAAPEDIELAGARASVRGTPAVAISLADLADIAYFQTQRLPPDVPSGLEASGRYRAEASIFANATHVCTCESTSRPDW
jgi:carbon-monoxide dehydrogenase large subunit